MRRSAHVAFLQRHSASEEHVEDLDTARLVIRFQSGDQKAFAELYRRYFDRVYGYLRLLLRESHEAEDTAQQVMMQVFEALPRYERRGERPFRAWLFTVVRNQAMQQLRTRNRTEVVDPGELARRRDGAVDEEAEGPTLQWISDQDLLLFVERLPVAQRQVLALRFMMGLKTGEIAEVLGQSTDWVRKSQSRAIGFLRSRLAAVGRQSSHRERAGARLYRRQARVVRARRFQLLHNGPVG